MRRNLSDGYQLLLLLPVLDDDLCRRIVLLYTNDDARLSPSIQLHIFTQKTATYLQFEHFYYTRIFKGTYHRHHHHKNVVRKWWWYYLGITFETMSVKETKQKKIKQQRRRTIMFTSRKLLQFFLYLFLYPAFDMLMAARLDSINKETKFINLIYWQMFSLLEHVFRV